MESETDSTPSRPSTDNEEDEASHWNLSGVNRPIDEPIDNESDDEDYPDDDEVAPMSVLASIRAHISQQKTSIKKFLRAYLTHKKGWVSKKGWKSTVKILDQIRAMAYAYRGARAKRDWEEWVLGQVRQRWFGNKHSDKADL